MYREKNATTYIGKAINLINLLIQSDIDCPLRQKTVKLKWTATTLDFVEWIYGLHELLNQKGEKVSLQTLFDVLNPIFHMDVRNYRQYFKSIKNRKKTEHQSIFEKQNHLLTQRKEKSFQ